MLLQRCKRRTTGVKPFYMIIDLLLVRVDHLQEAVVAVVDPLRHIGGNRLVGHNQRAAGLGDFAHLAVEVLDGLSLFSISNMTIDLSLIRCING